LLAANFTNLKRTKPNQPKPNLFLFFVVVLLFYFYFIFYFLVSLPVCYNGFGLFCYILTWTVCMPTSLPVCLLVCPPASLSTCLPACLCVRRPPAFLSTCLLVCLLACLSVHLLLRQFVCPPACLVHLHVYDKNEPNTALYSTGRTDFSNLLGDSAIRYDL